MNGMKPRQLLPLLSLMLVLLAACGASTLDSIPAANLDPRDSLVVSLWHWNPDKESPTKEQVDALPTIKIEVLSVSRAGKEFPAKFRLLMDGQRKDYVEGDVIHLVLEDRTVYLTIHIRYGNFRDGVRVEAPKETYRTVGFHVIPRGE